MHVLAVWAFMVVACSASLSGLYGDSGGGQTVLRHALTSSERLQLEHEMLSLLGLRTRPRAVSNLSSSASAFLLAVYDYKNHLPASGVAGFQLSTRDRRAVDRSDAVVSFAGRGHHAGGMRHERGKRLWFDVSEVPADETIIGAELRLYHTANVMGPVISSTLSLYQLTSVNEGQKELQFVDSVNTSSDHEGWLVLNMTGPFTTWVSLPEANLGLHLSVHLSSQPDHEKQPEEMGIVVDSHNERHEPFMVAFLKTPKPRQLHIREVREAGKRRKRVGDSSWKTGYVQDSFYSDSLQWNRGSRTCQIHNLHVDFKELNWTDWIIAPEQFNAFFCSGECNFPLNAHVYPTNHAIVQTLAHLENPEKVPKPSCAPTKLAPVSILHYTDENTIAVHNYREMIAKSCGCH